MCCVQRLSCGKVIIIVCCSSGEHQMELLDFVAAKFHEEGGVFKLLVSREWCFCVKQQVDTLNSFLAVSVFLSAPLSVSDHWLHHGSVQSRLHWTRRAGWAAAETGPDALQTAEDLWRSAPGVCVCVCVFLCVSVCVSVCLCVCAKMWKPHTIAIGAKT